jgi:sugar transport protein
MLRWMITVGILVSYIVALIIFAAWPASAAASGWRLVLGLGAVPALIGLALRTQMPARRGDRPDLRASPHRARGRSARSGRRGAPATSVSCLIPLPYRGT